MNAIYIKIYGENLTTGKPYINKDRETGGLVKALFVASISFYGKLFTVAKGRYVKLERSIYDIDKDKELHDELMKYRHGYTAHSGEDKVENVNVIIAIPPDKKAKIKPPLLCELYQPDSVSPEEVTGLIDLVNKLHVKILGKVETLDREVYRLDIMSKGLKYWHA
jgi:hypothetical protein